MGLPLIPEFADFLRSLSLDKMDQRTVQLFPEEFTTDGQRHVGRDRAITLWYTPTAVSWEGLVRRVQSELRAKKHKDSAEVVHALLAALCLHPKKDESPVENFNLMLDAIVDVNLTQFFILPYEPPPTLRRFSIGPFIVGALDLPKLESRSRNAGSDYHKLYGGSHLGKLTVERGVIPARMVDWKSTHLLTSPRALDEKEISDRLIHGYYSALNRDYFEDFWRDFLESQALFISLGAPYLAPDKFKLIPGTSSVSIFMTEDWGHVAPVFAPMITLDFVSADKRFSQVQTELREFYSFAGFTASDQHQTLKSFANFTGRGKRHLANGQLDEGYLHHIIALDLVFGGGHEQISKTVSERVALIVHKPLGQDFDEAVGLLNRAYSARSKYVHEGRSVDAKLIVDIERISREVMLCILRLQRDSGRISVERWLANLDYFVKAIKSQRSISPEELRANGIATDKETRKETR